MAGHEWDWFQREELIGQISDIRVQNLQVERENVQKRTFTRWINLHLEKCNPPLEVKDLFLDIQDGKILMALLEVLTGQSLLHEYKSSTHRIFRLNNIAKALKFLEDSNVKLVSIDAAEITDGNPSLVLGLIWNIILFLQIKELTGNLNRMSSSSSLSSLPSGTESDTSHPSTPSTEKSMSVSIRDQRRAIKALLYWVQQRTRKYGVAVQDFAGSWRSGLAFLAIIKAIDSSLVDMKKALERSPRDNLEDAFNIAKNNLNIPRLLEPEDVMVDSPDAQSIMTYVTQFLQHFPELDPDEFAEENEEAPLEMMYVRYKDGPTEEEGKIITVSRNEDTGYTVELQTRPLTPPQTYAEVDIPYDDKPNSEKSGKNPFLVPTINIPDEGMNADDARLKLDNVLRRLEMSPRRSDLARRSPVGPEHNGEGHQGGYEGPINPFTISNGKNSHPYTGSVDDVQSNSTFSFGDDSYSETSSLFSSVSDKEPNELFYQTEVGKRDPKSAMACKDDDDYKYVSHHPSDSPDGSNSKQLTVFQAYRASEHDGQVQASESEAERDETDSTDTPKISIIPHDLFYYPHYSVPIADVLQAFSDNCPDSLLEQTFTFDVSSEERTGDTSTLSSGVYLDTESTGSDTSIEESQEMVLGLENFGHNLHYAKIMAQESEDGSMANGSVAQAARNVRNNAFHAGYNYGYQDGGTDSSEDEWNGKWSGREVYVCGRGDLDDDDDDDEDLPEDREDKEAADTEEFWLTRDVQNDGCIHRRGELNTAGHSNVGAYKNVNGEGEQILGFGKQSTNQIAAPKRHSATSRAPFFGRQPPDTLHVLIALWILCYFLLILPELDLSKVSFFVESD
ncbi:calmin [Hyla sarda]|uniref:calmin n=1 Tax=Hyla sarda TaxID=327740 RepID=UPI0024C27114|nr:calmin [Hyla sarda]